jgi:hypothetical protein
MEYEGHWERVKHAQWKCADRVARQIEVPGHETSRQSALAPHSYMPAVYTSMHMHICAHGYVCMRVILLKAPAGAHTHTVVYECRIHTHTNTHTHTYTRVRACVHASRTIHMPFLHDIDMYNIDTHTHTYIYTCTYT